MCGGHGEAGDACERTEEAIGEGTARISVKAPELKGSWRKVEALYHQDSLGEATSESAV